jgi:hypothetical protein
MAHALPCKVLRFFLTHSSDVGARGIVARNGVGVPISPTWSSVSALLGTARVLLVVYPLPSGFSHSKSGVERAAICCDEGRTVSNSNVR